MKKKISKTALKKGIAQYIESISRTITSQERVPTGRRDSHGHEVYVLKPILNDAGVEIKRREYVVPPTITALCKHLNISRETWRKYSEDENYAEICAAAKDEFRRFNEEELLRRSGKDIKGIIFNLQNNYGYSERSEVKVGGVEEYLRSLEGELEL